LVTDGRSVTTETPPLVRTENGDALYYQDDTLCDRYAPRLTAGETYLIIMRSEDFDSYFLLVVASSHLSALPARSRSADLT